MAETPSFPNCVAWGDTPEEAIEILESVVTATIQTYQERGYSLPPGLTGHSKLSLLYDHISNHQWGLRT